MRRMGAGTNTQWKGGLVMAKLATYGDHKPVINRSSGRDGWRIVCACGWSTRHYRYICEENWLCHLDHMRDIESPPETRCRCNGHGWLVTDRDVWEHCPEHFKGQPHPEMIDEETAAEYNKALAEYQKTEKGGN